MRSATIPNYPEGVPYKEYLEKTEKLRQSLEYEDYLLLRSKLPENWQVSDKLYTHYNDKCRAQIQVFDADSDKILWRRRGDCSDDRTSTLVPFFPKPFEGVKTRILLIRDLTTGIWNEPLIGYLADKFKLDPLVFSPCLKAENLNPSRHCHPFTLDGPPPTRTKLRQDPLPSRQPSLLMSIKAWDILGAYVPPCESTNEPGICKYRPR